MGIEEFGAGVGANPLRNAVWQATEAAPPNEYGGAAIDNPKMWGVIGGDTFHAVGDTTKQMPLGFYRFAIIHPVGLCALKVRNDTDSLIYLPDSESDRLLKEIEEFLEIRGRFSERGLLYKRGVMLYGPPGSGKTATIQLLAKMISERIGSIAILGDSDPKLCSSGLHMIRKLEPQRQLVVIFEDLDALVSRYGEEGYLSILDGENQVENVIYIATTNYPERLDRRFVDRPSRFDTLRKIGMPSADARRTYLQHKEPHIDPAELEEMVSASDGYSIAHLRELLVLTKCFGRDMESAKARIDGMRVGKPSVDGASKLGFA